MIAWTAISAAGITVALRHYFRWLEKKSNEPENVVELRKRRK
jgi:predicted oxidoreductase (fatty acid repression mutant protein)